MHPLCATFLSSFVLALGVQVRWTHPTAEQENVRGFVVYERIDTNFIRQGSVPWPSNSFAIPGVPPGTHRFVVTATNQAGLESDYSAEASVVVSNQPSTIITVWVLGSSNITGPWTNVFGLTATNSVNPSGFYKPRISIQIE